jgi:Heterokaryon incompatibility protein (HET)
MSMAMNVPYGQIKEWIQQCRTTHATFCPQPKIDSSLDHIYLVDCINERLVKADTTLSYLTLSYVWGLQHESRKPVLASQPHDAKFPIPLIVENMPLTIRDAIIVVKELQMEYLWVDRYCVPQEDAVEKHNMIERMDDIYENAEATIVALKEEVILRASRESAL